MLELLAAGFLLGLTHAMPPGPITVEVLRRGAASCFGAAFAVDVGAVLADAAFFALVAAGLLQVVRYRQGQLIVLFLGCGLLLFLGARGIYSVMRSRAVEGPRPARELPPLATGFLICITSPFAIVWWVSVFTSSVPLLGASMGAMVTMFAGIALACLAWYALVGASGAAGKRLLTPGLLRALTLACSGLMLAFAAIMLYRGLALL